MTGGEPADADAPAGESWHHGFADVEPGVRLHYVEQGDGPLLLLLHGFPDFWYSWRHQIPALAEAGYHVVAPDLRGYNDSSKPRDVRAYRMQRLSADVRALIQHFGEERAVIVGHDWGGAVAWQFALRHRRRTHRLIVLNAPHPAAYARNMRWGRRLNLRQLRRSWYVFFFQLPWLPEYVLARNDYRFIANVFRGAAVHKDAFPDDVIRRYKEAAAKPGALRGGINYYRASFRAGGLPRLFAGRRIELPKLEMPTLVIWGAQDAALGVELTQGMDRYFAGPFQVKYVPDASHWVHQERPHLCNEYVREFLEQQR